MTREQAKREIDNIDFYLQHHTDDYSERSHDAMMMAIQALSREPISLDDINNALEASFRNGVRSAKVEQEPCDDAISRADFESHLFENYCVPVSKIGKPNQYSSGCFYKDVVKCLDDLPSVTQKSGKWIPVSERLPEDLEPVNITWVNHEPEPYYHDIKDRNFVATGIYYRGQWYWYSTTCADYLGEYGSNEIDKVDDAVEIIAWMPLPKPYEPQESEE